MDFENPNNLSLWGRISLEFKRSIYIDEPITATTTNTYVYKKLKGKNYLIGSFTTIHFPFIGVGEEKQIRLNLE